MIESRVIEVSFITDTSNNWCINSGATKNICNSLQWFKSTRKCSDGKVMLTLGSSATVFAAAIGVVVLEFQDNKTLILSYVLYVPLMRYNLISVSELSNKGYSFTFGIEVVIKRNGSFICSGIRSNGLYVITSNVSDESMMELNNSMVTIPTKRKEHSSNPTRLWHMMLSHINLIGLTD